MKKRDRGVFQSVNWRKETQHLTPGDKFERALRVTYRRNTLGGKEKRLTGLKVPLKKSFFFLFISLRNDFHQLNKVRVEQRWRKEVGPSPWWWFPARRKVVACHWRRYWTSCFCWPSTNH
jgi:hypothetical protein